MIHLIMWAQADNLRLGGQMEDGWPLGTTKRGLLLPTGKAEIQQEFMLGFQNLPLFITA